MTTNPEVEPPVKISPEALREVEAALRRYETTVYKAGLMPKTEHTYLLHANNFVRWLKDEFEPGSRRRN